MKTAHFYIRAVILSFLIVASVACSTDPDSLADLMVDGDGSCGPDENWNAELGECEPIDRADDDEDQNLAEDGDSTPSDGDIEVPTEAAVLESLCEGVYCTGRGSCVVIERKAHCICNSGFHDENLSCRPNDPTDPCKNVSCGNDGECIEDGETITCNCPEGFFNFGLNCIREEEQSCNMTDIGNDFTVCLQTGNPAGDPESLYFPSYGETAETPNRKSSGVDHRRAYLEEFLSGADNQGQCGTCVAFATSHGLEALKAMEFSSAPDISQSHVWSMSGLNLNCTNGTSINQVVAAVSGSRFVVPESIWDYICTATGGSCYGSLAPAPAGMNEKEQGLLHGVSPYWVWGKSAEQIEQALDAGYNVIYGVPVYGSAWNAWFREVVIDVPRSGDAYQGGHAILIVGFNRAAQQFEFLNSWSTQWGDNGYGKFTYDFIRSYGYGGMVIRDYLANSCDTDDDCSCGACLDSACTPVEEIYNQYDDNCDGRKDEGFDCAPDETRACGGTDTGECQAGTQSCIDGRWSDCEGEIIGPQPESCDNLDNDCNGLTDDHLTQECGSDLGECSPGYQLCTAGEWGSCWDAVGPTDETCDGFDNDCDGTTDNNLDPADIPEESRCPSEGICASGATNYCEDSHWQCDYPEGYSEEECDIVIAHCEAGSFSDSECWDGIDNDCDGITDENDKSWLCEQAPDYWKVEQGIECYQGNFGHCLDQAGQHQCQINAATCNPEIVCNGGTSPTAEKCDNEDWDCDGFTWDRNDHDHDGYGDCEGNEDCDDYDDERYPGAEEICDGKDNDCDTITDEGLIDCDPDIIDGDEDSETDGDVDPWDRPELVWLPIPQGTFMMGCSEGDTECFSAGTEEPVHEVSIQPFEMLETEVTREQFEGYLGWLPEQNHGECSDCPVENISYRNAEAFCEAAGGRLPSEAEWEYAARAGTTTKYYCGSNLSCLATIAWLEGPTHAVAGKLPNAWGLYDMLGNVWEWVEDCSHRNYNGAPDSGEAWIDGGDCSLRVLRGGCWVCSLRTMRASARAAANPETAQEVGVGIRCARDLPVVEDGDIDDEITDGDDEIADSDVSDGDDEITDNDATDGDSDFTDGDTADGDEEMADSENSDGDVSDGDEEITDGDVTDGDVTDGDVTDGDVTDGDVSDGDEEATDGDEETTDSDVTDGDEPVSDGDDEISDSDVADSEVIDGDVEITDGDDPVVDGDEETSDIEAADNDVSDGDVTDGDEPVVDGDAEVTDGDEPIVDGDEEVIDGDESEDESDSAEEEEDEPEPLDFGYVCAGSFWMGCSPDDTSCGPDDPPASEVDIYSDFELTIMEITQYQFETIMGYNPSVFGDCPNCPVENVTWFEASAFCEAVDSRLPTDAEWEYAARAGTTTRYYCGTDASCLDTIAWYGESPTTGSTHTVGQLEPNNNGLYDMLGNVKEWTEGGDLSSRSNRGGSWNNAPDALRVSKITSLNPNTSNGYIGFRCARDYY